MRASSLKTLLATSMAVAVVWTLGLAALLGWNLRRTHRQTVDLATVYARAFFQEIQTTRRWNAQHGGVYVPVTSATPPNPYLKTPNREVVTADGLTLTKINPAYMTRQIAAIAGTGNQVTFHITSLKPIRPENKPDAWETVALQGFEQGERERTEMVPGDSSPGQFRYMAPLRTEASCLKCHGEQGYHEGDLRGGISVSADASPLLASEHEQMATQVITHGIVWLIGLCGVGLVTRALGHRIRALETSEEKHRALFEGSADGVFLMTDTFLDCNDRACHLLGADRESIVGASPADYSPPTQPDGRNSTEAAKERISAAFAGTPQYFYWQHWRKDHVRVDTEVSVKAVTVNNVEMLQAIVRDVTERKRAEAAMQDSEARFRLLSENAPFGISLMRADLTFEYLNPRFTELLGYTREDLPDKYRWFELAYPDPATRQQVIGMWRADVILEPVVGCLKTHTLTIRCKDGTDKICHIRSVILPDGRHLVTYEDVTARTRAEETLRESEERYRHLFENLTDAVLIVDLETGCVLQANRQAEMLLGKPRQEIIATHYSHCHPRSQAPDYAGIFADQNGTTHASLCDIEVLRGDGSTVPVMVNSSTVALGGRRVVLALFRDMTEHKRAEQALREAKAAAEAASSTKSEFLASMSHEIRTPMTSILGFAENLLDPQMSEGERFIAINTIRRNGEHLLEVINDILDISKVEAGRLTIERVPCSPFQIVADVQSLMIIRAREKNLTFHVEFLGRTPETIHTDPGRLRQILVNLVGNAIKFTENGGVRLVTRFIPGTEDKGPFLQFDVIDTGIGMNAQQISTVFEPFTQADSSITRRFGGTGLGLTIGRHLAEMLDGNITVESKPGEGSAFRLTVATGSVQDVRMVEDPSLGAVSQPAPPEPAQVPTKLDCRILLAEDGPDNQRLIAFVLKKAGAKVTIAENGQIAVDKALAAYEAGMAFDAILMDMQMPVLDGYEATSMLRQKGYTGRIIALTAHAMTSDRAKCLDVGCDDYAVKPIDRQKLIDTIAQSIATPAQV